MNYFDNISPLELGLLIVFALSFLIQVFYFLYFFVRIALYKNTTSVTQTNPTSVVICARNEESNLRELIPLLMDQDHPEFEVVVVDDSSWDGTDETLQAFSVTYPNLRIISLDEDKQNMSGKKFALTLGIKGAKYDTVLLSDADCRPFDRTWIRQMSQKLIDKKEIVLGFSPYKKESGFLNKLIRFDAFQIGINYMSFALASVPYMGVGRNLCYSKKVFFDNSGFKNHFHIQSGDDDLFINEVSNEQNTTIALNVESQSESIPKTSFKDWWKQKTRHFTTSHEYKGKHKLLLSLFPISFYTLLISGITLISLHTFLLLVSVIIVLRYILQIAIFRGSSMRMGQGDLVFLAPLYEIVLMTVIPLMFISNLNNKPSQWK